LASANDCRFAGESDDGWDWVDISNRRTLKDKVEVKHTKNNLNISNKGLILKFFHYHFVMATIQGELEKQK